MEGLGAIDQAGHTYLIGRQVDVSIDPSKNSTRHRDEETSANDRPSGDATPSCTPTRGVKTMKNWNYEEAKHFVRSIDDEVTRTLTKFFLNRLLGPRTRAFAEPEADFDLLFYVKMVADISATTNS